MEIHAKPRRTKKETQKGGEESVDFVAWEDEFQLVVFGVGKMQTPYLIGFLYIYILNIEWAVLEFFWPQFGGNFFFCKKIRMFPVSLCFKKSDRLAGTGFGGK